MSPFVLCLCTIVIDNEKAWPNQFRASPHVGTASRPLPILSEFLHFDILVLGPADSLWSHHRHETIDIALTD